jgi:hypothetical protein
MVAPNNWTQVSPQMFVAAASAAVLAVGVLIWSIRGLLRFTIEVLDGRGWYARVFSLGDLQQRRRLVIPRGTVIALSQNGVSFRDLHVPHGTVGGDRLLGLLGGLSQQDSICQYWTRFHYECRFENLCLQNLNDLTATVGFSFQLGQLTAGKLQQLLACSGGNSEVAREAVTGGIEQAVRPVLDNTLSSMKFTLLVGERSKLEDIMAKQLNAFLAGDWVVRVIELDSHTVRADKAYMQWRSTHDGPDLLLREGHLSRWNRRLGFSSLGRDSQSGFPWAKVVGLLVALLALWTAALTLITASWTAWEKANTYNHTYPLRPGIVVPSTGPLAPIGATSRTGGQTQEPPQGSTGPSRPAGPTGPLHAPIGATMIGGGRGPHASTGNPLPTPPRRAPSFSLHVLFNDRELNEGQHVPGDDVIRGSLVARVDYDGGSTETVLVEWYESSSLMSNSFRFQVDETSGTKQRPYGNNVIGPASFEVRLLVDGTVKQRIRFIVDH